MKVKPVKFYKIPQYPTRAQFLESSASLKDSLPAGWKNNKIVTAALAVFLLGTNAGKEKSVQPLKEKVQLNNDNSVREDAKIIEKENVPSVAPVFIHGGGRGAIGCVVINPPAFLSEEEARLIIEEELYKENIIFDKKNYKLDDQVFMRKGYYEDKKDTVILDGYSTQYNLGYEFVEADDYLKFGGMTDMSTVQDFDVIEAAENLRIKLKENGKINAVIFYDPMENYERGYEKNEKYEQMKEWNNLEENKEESCRLPGGTSAKEKSIEMLKRQVNDFIEWVKKEGILKDK